ncbi:MAG: hypothetical protein PVI57_01605 [Gemmatimonadota bacterium]|jgi:hypothetical protein
MGTYDDITPEQLRKRLARFARLVLKLEERGDLLERSPAIMKLMGELRRMLFAYEVRCTGNLLPRKGEEEADAPAEMEDTDPSIEDSARIVQEALERERELQDELRDRLFPDDD